MEGDWTSTLGDFDARDHDRVALIAKVRAEVHALARGLLLDELRKRLLADLAIVQRSLLNNQWEESPDVGAFKEWTRKLIASRLPEQSLVESRVPDSFRKKDWQSWLASSCPFVRLEGGEVLLEKGSGDTYSGLFAKGGDRLSLEAMSSVGVSPGIWLWISAIHADTPYCLRLLYEFDDRKLDVGRYLDGAYTSDTDVQEFIAKKAGCVSSDEVFAQSFPPERVVRFFASLQTTNSPQSLWRAIRELVADANIAEFKVLDAASRLAGLMMSLDE